MAVQDGYAFPSPSSVEFGPNIYTGDDYGVPQVYFAPSSQPGEEVTGLGFQDGAYIMRAFKTTPTTGHVYWVSREVPDLVGEKSGYPPIDLADIIILRNPCQADPRDLP